MTAVAVAALVVLTLLALRATMAASRRARVGDRLAAGAGGPAGGQPARRRLLRPPPWFVAALDRAAVPVEPAAPWTAWVALVVAVTALAALAGGPGLAGVAALAGGGGPLLGLSLARDRRDRRLTAGLPEALEAVARGLRSGASLRLALGEAATAVGPPLAQDLSAHAAAVAAGAELGGVLDRWADERPLPAVRLAGAALALGVETGGSQARALDGVAETLRARLAVAGEVRALSSQARLSALVIALSPLVFCAFATATDPRTADFLFRTPIGLVCLTAGLALDALAAVWMTRLCRSAA